MWSDTETFASAIKVLIKIKTKSSHVLTSNRREISEIAKYIVLSFAFTVYTCAAVTS